jgi:hypothetical protein
VEFNNRIESFPSSIIADHFGFHPADYFQTPAEDQALPKVDLSLGARARYRPRPGAIGDLHYTRASATNGPRGCMVYSVAHIRDYDIRPMMIAVLMGGVATLADFFTLRQFRRPW